jgi:uncharacterized protein with FMN-binding domain
MLSAAALAALVSSTAISCAAPSGAVTTEPATSSEATTATMSAPSGQQTADTGAATAAVSAGATSTAGGWADGTYTGEEIRTRYGDVQVAVTIEGGAIVDVEFLAYPTGHESDEINAFAAPILVQEAIESQSADVDVVSGATLTSEAFMQSLDLALSAAL